MSAIRTGTGLGLIQFIEYMRDKSLMKRNTAGSYRAAVSKVLAIEGEGWESIDILHLDVDQQLERFETLSGSNYAPSSLATYKTRFSRAVEMYLQYLESPSSFKPQLQARRPGAGSPSMNTATSKTVKRETPETPAAAHVPGLIEYPFPLTTGEMAYLRLPRNLSVSDVDRLAAFLRSIPIDLDPPLAEGGE